MSGFRDSVPLARVPIPLIDSPMLQQVTQTAAKDVHTLDF